MDDNAHTPLIRIRPSRGWSALRLDELWEYRDMLVMLALRDIKLRYKQTALGIVWVVLQPMMAGLLFALIFGRFLKVPSDGTPYLLFVFAGLTGWQLFAGVVQRAGGSLVSEAKLITKVYFPRLLVPMAAAAAVLLDFLVTCGVMIVLLAFHGLKPSWEMLLLLPATVLTVMLGVGTSLWLSALSVRYRDFVHAAPFMLQVWMYASPIVYTITLIPEHWRLLFALNPMVGIIGLFRTGWLGSAPPAVSMLLIGAGISMAVLLSGWAFFQRLEREIADRV